MSDLDHYYDIGEGRSFSTRSESEGEQERENDEKSALREAYKVFDLEEDATIEEVEKKLITFLWIHNPDKTHLHNFRTFFKKKDVNSEKIVNAYETIFKNYILGDKEVDQKTKESLFNMLFRQRIETVTARSVPQFIF
jgi:hypothetical protein